MLIKFEETGNIDKYTFNSEQAFIEWTFKNKDKISKETFDFQNDININIDNIKNFINFLKYYIKIKKQCDKAVDNYNKKILQTKYNEEIKQALSEFVRMNSGGKYLRAMLVALGYNSANKNDNNYLDLALALEVFQTSILIHDDIIDNATVRRGIDTIPVAYDNFYQSGKKDFQKHKEKFSNFMALCIGDLGFYLAEEIIVNRYKNHQALVPILSYYHNIAIKTCQGEILDIILPFKERYFDTDKDLETKIMEIYKYKTAWYSIIGPFCLGLILGDVSKKEITQMEKILLNVGIAFQIKDDLLGIYGDKKHLGKSTISDIEEYKQTILYSYVMNTSYKNELLKYYGKANLKEKDINKIKNIFTDSGARQYAEEQMNKLFNKSLKELEKITFIEDENKQILKGFIIYLKNRTK